ncbi:RlpA-like double-psi beta-barrel-protein domain-containing protein-containing protein [Myxozyma melibiosi]|uniref:RlpA-like double-psi beta-barrel-protein domain-containing protein-containing protein n=1 Tax=Myxozyma melibiosi TaxID=54550 RepID=A0ABR1FFT3_9ASCO
MSAEDNGNSNNNPLCGKTITAYRGSKSVTVTVVDTCMGCDTYDLDFSPAAFDQLGEESEGRISITWSYDS